MRNIPNFIWISNSGLDRDQDKFHEEQLVMKDGRIIARIIYPEGDETQYAVSVYSPWAEDRYYFDFPAAKRYGEQQAQKILKKEYKTPRAKVSRR